MLLWRLLGSAFLVSTSLARLYVRQLPSTVTIDGLPAEGPEEVASWNECFALWKQNPPKLVIFNSTTKRCTVYNQVYSIQEGPDSAFLLDMDNEEFCQGDESEDLSEIMTCREGWKRGDVSKPTRSSYCYRLIRKTGMSENEILNLCKKAYPFSHAASIHSQEEEHKIAEIFTAPDSSAWHAVRIGLELMDIEQFANESAWRWADGSPMDYTNFNLSQEDGFRKICEKCSITVVLSWKNPMNNFMWTLKPERTNVGSMLCKYELN